MNFNETRHIIIESLLESKLISESDRDRLRREETADVDLASLPIDSLKVVDWCMALENKVKREVQVEELIEHDSLNRLAKFLSIAEG